MSGGHFNYKCFEISQFADELQHEIDVNNNINNANDNCGQEFRPETIERVKGVYNIIELAGDLARETEWLYSGDCGETTFCETVDKIMTTFMKGLTISDVDRLEDESKDEIKDEDIGNVDKVYDKDFENLFKEEEKE